MKAASIFVESSILPDASAISATRRIVDDISSQILADSDVGWRLAMAAHELLDNARKYGCEGWVRFRLEIGASSVVLSVENDRDEAHASELLGTIGAIRAAEDPWTFYLGALQRSAAQAEGSGIGLARISAEGQMTLSASIDESRVRVEARLEREAP
jgi:hypothetical protein